MCYQDVELLDDMELMLTVAVEAGPPPLPAKNTLFDSSCRTTSNVGVM